MVHWFGSSLERGKGSETRVFSDFVCPKLMANSRPNFPRNPLELPRPLLTRPPGSPRRLSLPRPRAAPRDPLAKPRAPVPLSAPNLVTKVPPRLPPAARPKELLRRDNCSELGHAWTSADLTPAWRTACGILFLTHYLGLFCAKRRRDAMDAPRCVRLWRRARRPPWLAPASAHLRPSAPIG